MTKYSLPAAAFAVIALFAIPAHAATINGTIFDEETTNALARTSVTLTPLPGTTARVVTQLANEHGQYSFTNVAPGWYLIRASRIGYAVAEFGQQHPGLPGKPFQVTDNDSANSESHQIIMRRQAAITGTIVDDNSIGIAGWPFNVYTARQPIRRIAQGTADDRGNFRIGELAPGSYIVRSGGGGLEDASTLVPSYYRYGTTVQGAEPVRVRLGETQAFVVIHTIEGRLFELSGDLSGPDKKNTKLTLITDTGRRLVATQAGPYTAQAVPPGLAGLLSEGPGCATYRQIMVDRNMTVSLDCAPLSPPTLTGDTDFPLIARRLDLDGPGPEGTLNPGQLLTPGPLEFTVRPGPGHYVVGIQNDGDKSKPPTAIDGWFALDLNNAPRLRITLSSKPASISGPVTSAGTPIVGAPVFLQLINPDAPELALESWTARADPQGNFTFIDLAPGTYRLLSSYQVDFADPVGRAGATTLTLREGDAVTQPLEMISE